MDLQIAKLNSESFTMTHQMSLAKITLKYKANVTNTILYTWNGSASTSTSGGNIDVLASREFSHNSPYVYPAYHAQENGNYIYYYIAKYDETPQMVDADEIEYKKWAAAITIQDGSGNPLGKNGYREFEAVSRAEIRGWCYYIGNFPHRTAVQQFTTPVQGTYRIECWGASSDDGTGVAKDYATSLIGRGGYVKGNINLPSSKMLFVYVGSMGVVSIAGDYSGGIVENTGGYNGGGNSSLRGGGGGGATDIRLSENDLNSRIMVAGGGGGANYYSNSSQGSEGGAAGGLYGLSVISRSGYSYITLGGRQNAGGVSPEHSKPSQLGETGSFGSGGSGWFGGGGGGWYGGSGGSNEPNRWYNGVTNTSVTNYDTSEIGGGGGSSFISGYTGCKAKSGYASSTNTSVVKYDGEEYEFTSGLEIWDGKGYKWNSSAATSTQGFKSPSGENENGHLGAGYARITFVSE